MEYGIILWDKDKEYVNRLREYLENHESKVFNVKVPDADMDIGSVSMANILKGIRAIFIGDGIEISLYDIPLGVKVAYLTEKTVATDALEKDLMISKYQRLEQIYQQMLKICESSTESGADNVEHQDDKCIYTYTRFADYELKCKESFEGVFMCYRMSADDVTDSVAMGMLTNNHISGMAPVICDGKYIKYNVTGKINIVDFLKKNDNACGKNKMLKLFNNILNTMLMLEEFMLDADRIILKPEYIYVDEVTLNCELLYYPLKNVELIDVRACLKDFLGICSELQKGINTLGDVVDKWTEEPKLDKNQEIYQIANEENDRTDILSDVRNDVRDDMSLNEMTESKEMKDFPYMIRRKNNEKIIINRNIFKLGKDEQYVDYCIKDNPTVSRNHADIIKKPNGYFVVDKGSLNHTFLNGRILNEGKARRIEDGDLIQISNEVFEYFEK